MVICLERGANDLRMI